MARKAVAILLSLAALAGTAPHARAWAFQQEVSNFIPFNPNASLVAGTDGNIYGTSATGGVHGAGEVVRITPGGSAVTLASFDGVAGGAPLAALTKGSDGNFYGATTTGGANGLGTIFSVTAGGTLTELVSFDGTNGASVEAPLVETGSGVFYGVSYYGGARGVGEVFKLTVTPGMPASLSGVASFTGADGSNPNSLVQLGGVLYGTTLQGGAKKFGTVFRVKLANAEGTRGTIETLVSMTQYNGITPTALIAGTDGNLYGISDSAESPTQTTGVPSGSIFKVTPAGKISVLAYFNFAVNGSSPNCLVQGPDGSFYGATTYGGGGNEISEDLGVLFKCVVTSGTGNIQILAGWPVTEYANGGSSLVYDAATQLFYGSDAHIANGQPEDSPGLPEVFSYGATPGYSELAAIPNPYAPPGGGTMIDGGDGNLYGITPAGGAGGQGSIFKITQGGAYLTLVNFDGTNGATPSSLLRGSDGAIYGTTAASETGDGTMFRMSVNGTLKTLATFEGSTTGGSPSALIQTGSDTFLGTASIGGAGGAGTLFHATVAGNTATITPIVLFAGGNGSGPNSIMEARDGSFYGTTAGGGGGDGTIFQLGASMDAGSFRSLISFTGTAGAAPGASPAGAPLEGQDGLFYGITIAGGSGPAGTVYRLTSAGPDSTLSSLLSFDSDHVPVAGGLLGGPAGVLYGASQGKGPYEITVSGSSGTLTDLAPYFENAFVRYVGFSVYSILQGSDGFFYLLTNEGVASVLAGNTAGTGPAPGKSTYVDGCVESLLPNRPGFFSATQTTESFRGSLALPEGKETISPVEGYISLDRPNNIPLTVQYNDYDDDGAFYVFAQDAMTRYQGVARERETFTGSRHAAAAGQYTLLLTPSDASGNPIPDMLQGYGVLKVAANGMATLTGNLSDGTPFAAVAAIHGDDTISFQVPLYAKGGGLAGTVTFEADAGVSDCDGVLQWVRPAEAGAKPVMGLATNLQLLGSKYSPGSLARNATLTLTGTSLPTITHTLAVSTAGKVTVTNPGLDKTVVTLNRATGAFSGTFTDPGTGAKGRFGGVIYQDEGDGAGELEIGGALGAVDLTFP